MSTAPSLPNIAEIVGPLLSRVRREQRPLFIAIAERLAGRRYRAWAADPANAAHAARLLACAAREDDIASRVEALYPDADALARTLLAEHPDLADVDRTIFGGRPFAEQFAIQATGERVGSATWRTFAANESDPERRATFLACAPLEEASAEALEAILAGA
jgi:hypothetical protein